MSTNPDDLKQAFDRDTEAVEDDWKAFTSTGIGAELLRAINDPTIMLEEDEDGYLQTPEEDVAP